MDASIYEFIALVLIGVVMVPPFWRLLPRAGIPAQVAFAAIVPVAALILLWMIAFRRWPGDPPAKK